MAAWERRRHREAHWFIECVAEAMGVFFYCFAGVGASAAYTLGNLLGLPLGSVFSVGFAYAMGIGLALVVCSATSGGHFNPAVTILCMLFKGFPVGKGMRYIVAQILGGYIACLIVYLSWKHLITEVEALLVVKGTLDEINFTSSGPAGIFALYVPAGSPLGLVLFNEFVTDFVIGMAICACTDPTNFLIPPMLSPWIIGMTYGIAIWGYSTPGLAANAARDVGGRLAAMTIWGTKAAGGNYAALAALTNIPATLFAYIVYEVFFVDSSRVIAPAQQAFMTGHKAHMEHLENGQHRGASPSSDLEEKAHESRSE